MMTALYFLEEENIMPPLSGMMRVLGCEQDTDGIISHGHIGRVSDGESVRSGLRHHHIAGKRRKSLAVHFHTIHQGGGRGAGDSPDGGSSDPGGCRYHTIAIDSNTRGSRH